MWRLFRKCLLTRLYLSLGSRVLFVLILPVGTRVAVVLKRSWPHQHLERGLEPFGVPFESDLTTSMLGPPQG